MQFLLPNCYWSFINLYYPLVYQVVLLDIEFILHRVCFFSIQLKVSWGCRSSLSVCKIACFFGDSTKRKKMRKITKKGKHDRKKAHARGIRFFLLPKNMMKINKPIRYFLLTLQKKKLFPIV